MSHTVELIAVGTELLLGNIANTDAQMLSQGLSALGLNVYYHTVVGDNPERLRAAVEIAKSRADIIITTGGLGPTCDDLTKTVLAEAFGKKLVFDEHVGVFRVKAEHQPNAEFVQTFQRPRVVRARVLFEQRVVEFPDQFARLDGQLGFFMDFRLGFVDNDLQVLDVVFQFFQLEDKTVVFRLVHVIKMEFPKVADDNPSVLLIERERVVVTQRLFVRRAELAVGLPLRFGQVDVRALLYNENFG